MARRHYSVAEVEALIPTLEQLFTQILQLRVGLRGIEQKLERAGVTIEIEELGTSQAAGEAATDDSDSDSDLAADRDQDHDRDRENDREAMAGRRLRAGAETPQVRQARAVFRGFYEALSDGLERVRALGGEVKDLDMGLVDFLGRRGNEDILLCWRLGEKRIEYWHAIDGGFASRKPLDERVPGTPSGTPPRLD